MTDYNGKSSCQTDSRFAHMEKTVLNLDKTLYLLEILITRLNNEKQETQPKLDNEKQETINQVTNLIASFGMNQHPGLSCYSQKHVCLMCLTSVDARSNILYQELECVLNLNFERLIDHQILPWL